MGEIEVYASELAELARKEPGKYEGKRYRLTDGALMTFHGTELTDKFIITDGLFAFEKVRLYFANNTQVEEIKQLEPATWQKAFLAGLKGLKIKPLGQYGTYPDFKDLNFAIVYLANRPDYAKNLISAEWYIED